jgi:hypothetical protein
MVAFIEDHRMEYGVEPICRVLPIAPATYYAHRARARDLALPRSSGHRGYAAKARERQLNSVSLGLL